MRDGPLVVLHCLGAVTASHVVEQPDDCLESRLTSRRSGSLGAMEWMLARRHSSDEEWPWWGWVLAALFWGTLIWLDRKKRQGKVSAPRVISAALQPEVGR